MIDSTIAAGRNADKLFCGSSTNISGSGAETKRRRPEVILGDGRHTEPERSFDTGFGRHSPPADPPLSRREDPRRWAAHRRNQPASPRSLHPVKEESDTRTQFANKAGSERGLRSTWMQAKRNVFGDLLCI